MLFGQGFFSGELTEQNILEFVNNRRMKAEDLYRPFFARTKRWYNTTRGIISGNSFSNRNDVSIPMLFSYIMSDVAAKSEALFGGSNIVEFIPTNSAEGPIARKNTKLVNLQLDDSKTYQKGVDFLMSASIYGTGIAPLTWKHEERAKLYRTRVLDQEMVVKDMQVTFDGPDWNVVDILDFLPEPGKVRHEVRACLA